MDKKHLEDMLQPSIIERFNEIQKQIDPLYQIKNSSKLSEIMEQSVRMSSASNIGEIAKKVFQESSLDFTSFENKSALARSTDLDFQDTITSVNLARNSVEQYRNAFNAVQALIKTSEISTLVSYIQSQNALTNSVLSDYASIFNQVESVHSLESFKAIFRLKNFPLEGVMPNESDSLFEIDNVIDETVLELDAEISDELSLIEDFNELSEERRTILLELYQAYYYPIILNCLVVIVWLQVMLDESLDLTNNTFIFVEKSKEKLSYLGNVCRPKPSGIIEGLIGSAIFTLIMKVFGQ